MTCRDKRVTGAGLFALAAGPRTSASFSALSTGCCLGASSCSPCRLENALPLVATFIPAVCSLAALIACSMPIRCAICSPGLGTSNNVPWVSPLLASDRSCSTVAARLSRRWLTYWSAALVLLRWISPAAWSIMERSSGIEELVRLVRGVVLFVCGVGTLSRTMEYRGGCARVAFLWRHLRRRLHLRHWPARGTDAAAARCRRHHSSCSTPHVGDGPHVPR